MTTDNNQQKFEELLRLFWDGELSKDHAQELGALLTKQPELQIEYVKAVHARHDLIDLCHAFDMNAVRIDIAESMATEVDHANYAPEISLPVNVIKPNANKSYWLSSNLRWAAVAACILVGFSSWYSVQPKNPNGSMPLLADQAGVGSENSNQPISDLGEYEATNYVALISALSDDVVWGEVPPELDFLMRVKPGEEFLLEGGAVQLRYLSGARIVLKGPVHFEVTGQASGRLIRGQFSGEVTKGDFSLEVPGAKIIDLGTAFGVTVDESDTSNVFVFDGEVSLASNDQGKTSSSLNLTEGMSATVGRDGKIVESDKGEASRVVREVLLHKTTDDTDELSAVDIINSFDSTRVELSKVIDPVEGGDNQQPWLLPYGPGDRSGTGKYEVTSWHDTIDGVFIPSSNGLDVQIDSAGSFVDLPENNGKTWGPIWSRRCLPNIAPNWKQNDFWGTETLPILIDRLERAKHGMVGIHANAGITFDLQAIRKATDRNLGSFATVVANVSNLKDRMLTGHRPHDYKRGKRYSADLRLYIDGVLRESRLDFSRDDGEQTMTIDLGVDDRFLTIVSTDGRSGNAYDHVVLIDPVFCPQ